MRITRTKDLTFVLGGVIRKIGLCHWIFHCVMQILLLAACCRWVYGVVGAEKPCFEDDRKISVYMMAFHGGDCIDLSWMNTLWDGTFKDISRDTSRH